MAGGGVMAAGRDWPARAANLHVTYRLRRTIREGSRGPARDVKDVGLGARSSTRPVFHWQGAVPVAAMWKFQLGVSPDE